MALPNLKGWKGVDFMARMHSGAKGKSGSKKPVSKSVPDWIELKPNEVVELIVTLNNQGHKKSEIGTILRDQYGIPSIKALTGKSVSKILEENNVVFEIPEDLMNLIRTSVKLQKHLKEHKKDRPAKRGLQLTVSKIRRLSKYYQKNKKLPKGWRYTEEEAQLLVK